jgi:DNA-binding NtrC family response regulator
MNRPRQNASSKSEGSAPLIYVVDDETVLLEMAAVILKGLGYGVETFPDAEAAWAAFSEARLRPCLVITDYARRGMTGLTLIAECRRMDPGQKTILVSGTQAEHIFRDVPCKPDRFLAKPYRAKDLIKAVVALVGPA